MSTVLAMRLNRDQAILVADESTWHLGHLFGYRRANYGDAFFPLLDGDGVDAALPRAVWCGVGFPSFQDEVARRFRSTLRKDPPRTNQEVSRRTHEAFLRTHGRMVDDKLRFDYGFTLAELNARRYDHEGETREIKQASVVAAARAMAAGSTPGNACSRIFSNSGLLVSHDSENGIQGWHLEPTGCHMGFTTPLAVIGNGDGIASHLMAGFLERRDVGARREGFELREGLYLLLRIAAEVHRRVGTMGGYLQILVLDGERGIREVVSDSSRLACEVLDAHLWGFLPRADAEALVASLVLENADDEAVEEELFARVGDQRARLERCLMGFKPRDTPLSSTLDPPGQRRSLAEEEGVR